MDNSATGQRRSPATLTASWRGIRSVLAFIPRAGERWRQRRHLEELDDNLLNDIGLRPQDVRRECSRAFWR